jgi:hypothetical protein
MYVGETGQALHHQFTKYRSNIKYKKLHKEATVQRYYTPVELDKTNMNLSSETHAY